MYARDESTTVTKPLHIIIEKEKKTEQHYSQINQFPKWEQTVTFLQFIMFLRNALKSIKLMMES